MKKRLFYETRLYDYRTKEEAEKHRNELELKGWKYREHRDDGSYIYENGCDTLPYSIEYWRQH
jgi:hypothetical protein